MPTFRKIVRFTVGTGPPVAVGVPPEQISNTSPVSSANPSARTIGGTDAFNEQLSAAFTCAEVVVAENSRTPSRIRMELLLTISVRSQ
jgi:hypothetical protein